jgi:hypothetical protein
MHGYHQHENAPSRGPSYDGLAADINDGKGGAMRDACPPFTGHQRDQLTRQMLTRQMVPEMQCDGRLACSPARGFALGTTPIATRGITSDPCTAPQLSLTCGCGNVVLLAPWPSVLARQTVTATRQLGCLVATTIGRHRGWGAHSISFGFDTHNPDPLLQAMGSTPGTPGPSVLVQETRKMALC